MLTEGSSEGYGVSIHLRGSSRDVPGPEGDPAGFRSAAQDQHPSAGPGSGLLPSPAGPTHSPYIHSAVDTFAEYTASNNEMATIA